MMKDNDLKRNASGYCDETAYKAITAPPRAGEIWRYEQTDHYALVLGGNETTSSCLKMTRNATRSETMIPVTIGQEVLYTEPVMIGYIFNNKLSGYVTKLHPETLAAIKKAVGQYLGITATDADKEEQLQSLTAENEGLKQSYKDIFSANEKLRRELQAKEAMEKDFGETVDKLNQQLACMSIYKDMYMGLIDKLVCARGGTVND